MRAIIYRDYGDPSVLKATTLERPTPAADEVLIRVEAAGVNPIDARMRSGEIKWILPGGFPRIPGYDVAGVVEAAGNKSVLKPGTRVLAFLDSVYGGAYAEYATCTHTSAVEIPVEMPFEEAAAIPLAASTALQSLRDHGHLASGQDVLITGASGGVGAFAVQIAVADGAQVTGVASAPHEDFVRSLGATDFIDYRQHNFTELDRKWDLVFDAAGKTSFVDVKRVLKPEGNFVSTEPSLMGLVVSLVTWPMSQHGKVMLARSRDKDLKELIRLYKSGQMKVTVAETFPLEEAARAHWKIEKDSFCGKIVITTKV